MFKDDQQNLYVRKLGLYLHSKFEIHLLITTIFNLISFVVVIGLFEFFEYPLITFNYISGIVILSLVTTLIMEVIKLFLVRHFFDLIYKSKGLIFLFLYIGVVLGTTYIFVDDVKFLKNVFIKASIFVVMFEIMKLLLVIALHRITGEKERAE